MCRGLLCRSLTFEPHIQGDVCDNTPATFGSDEEDTFSGVPRQVQGGAHSAGEPFRGIGGGRPRRLSESESLRPTNHRVFAVRFRSA